MVPVCQPLCCKPVVKPLSVAISKKYWTAAVMLASVADPEERVVLSAWFAAEFAGAELARPAGATLSTRTVTDAGEVSSLAALSTALARMVWAT